MSPTPAKALWPNPLLSSIPKPSPSSTLARAPCASSSPNSLRATGPWSSRKSCGACRSARTPSRRDASASSAMEAALHALEGFKRLMDELWRVALPRRGHQRGARGLERRHVPRSRADSGPGLHVDVIDGSEESRLVYLAVRDGLAGHPALTAAHALLVEVGGGSADITRAREGRAEVLGRVCPRLRPPPPGTPALAPADRERRVRLLTSNIGNVVRDIDRDIPMRSAEYMIALGGDVRLAAQELVDAPDEHVTRGAARRVHRVLRARREAGRGRDWPTGSGSRRCDAEALVPALLVYRALLLETSANGIIVPHASLRDGLLADLAAPPGGGLPGGLADFSRRCWRARKSLGEKYRYDAAHARPWRSLATRLFDELNAEHGLDARDRLLLEVAALLHDIGIFVGLRAHHKHAQYLISGVRDLRALVGRHAPSSPTWPATTGAACRSSRTCRTSPSTAGTRARQQAGGDAAHRQRARRRARQKVQDLRCGPPTAAGCSTCRASAISPWSAWRWRARRPVSRRLRHGCCRGAARECSHDPQRTGAASKPAAEARAHARAVLQPRTVVARLQRARRRGGGRQVEPADRAGEVRGDCRVEPRRVLHGARGRAEERRATKATPSRTPPGSRPRSSSSWCQPGSHALVAHLYSLVTRGLLPALARTASGSRPRPISTTTGARRSRRTSATRCCPCSRRSPLTRPARSRCCRRSA